MRSKFMISQEGLCSMELAVYFILTVNYGIVVQNYNLEFPFLPLKSTLSILQPLELSDVSHTGGSTLNIKNRIMTKNQIFRIL
jgi:hypothetical protein